MNYLITKIKVFVKVAFALFFLSTVQGFTADVNLAWDPNSESNLAGYRVYYGPSSGNYTVAINLGNQTTHTVTGLGVGTYYFVVTAYNTSGMESDASNEVAATVGVESVPSPVTVVATPGSGIVTVNWSGIPNPSTVDWIGRYSPNASPGAYADWKYTSSCGQSPSGTARAAGSCTLTMPSTPGTYEFRLFTNGSYSQLGPSVSITVSGSGGGGGGSPALTATPGSVTPGGAVTVGWSGISSPTVADWIGRYSPGAANTAYLDWKYTSTCNQSASGTARASGTCTFTMPTTPGVSEFRILTNGTYNSVGNPSLVSVGSANRSLTASPNSVGRGGTVTLIWDGISNATPNDWIGCYRDGESSSQGWIYTSSCTQGAGSAGAWSGSCTFTVPGVPGTYEFRLFENNGYTVLAQSGTVAVN